jgi:transcriptional regulator with XRE-family HTH domain
LLPFWAVPGKLKHRKIVGLAIRRYRTRASLSIEQLAEAADLHHNYIGEIERGEKAASIDTLVKIAKGLRVRPHRLLMKL